MTKLRYILPLLALCAFLAIESCETADNPCLQPRLTLLRAGAYKRAADTGTAVLDSALPNPIFIALTTFTTNNIFIQKTGTNKFGFQLSDLSDTCRWVIRPDSATFVQDTLTFIYQRQLHFISNVCGYTYYYNLTQPVLTTHHAIDSVRINNNDITSNASVEHLKIYY